MKALMMAKVFKFFKTSKWNLEIIEIQKLFHYEHVRNDSQQGTLHQAVCSSIFWCEFGEWFHSILQKSWLYPYFTMHLPISLVFMNNSNSLSLCASGQPSVARLTLLGACRLQKHALASNPNVRLSASYMLQKYVVRLLWLCYETGSWLFFLSVKGRKIQILGAKSQNFLVLKKALQFRT